MIQLIKNIIESMRPVQWSKNLVIFIPLIFSYCIINYSKVIDVLLAFVIFCLLSGSIYIINDICDLENDRKYPWMLNKPITSGRIEKKTAIKVSILITIPSILIAFFLNFKFGFLTLIYFVLMVAYSLWFKKLFILNISIVTFGFLLRIISGIIITDIRISFLLLMSILFLVFSLAACKYRYKLIFLKNNIKNNLLTKTLEEYKIKILDVLIIVTAFAAGLYYVFFVIFDINITKRINSISLIYSIPFALCGILRYIYLIFWKNHTEIPEQFLYKDLSLRICLIIWIIIVSINFYFNILLTI